MSSPIWSAGIASAATTVAGASASNSGATTMSVGQHDLLTPDARPRSRYAADGVQLVLLQQALADLVALRLQEREHHPAADEQRVGLAEQVVDHAELVGHLRAAEHAPTYGRAGSSVSRRSTSTSRSDQTAGRVREPLGDVVHAGLLAVHDAEAVADERVGERRS